ncbi:hypothetical protein GFPCMMHI_02532 [Ensifer adhaerens]|nr:hypothetical protein [Ensifer adhaerens]
MFRQVLLVAVAAVTLYGCQTAPQTSALASEPKTPYALTDADRIAIRDGFRTSIRDPNSLVLGEAKATKNSAGVVTVCGVVNGKNGFGGYTGFVPYLGVLGTQDGRRIFAVVNIGDGSSNPQAIAMVCAQNGIT